MKAVVLHGSLRDLLPAEYNGRFECDFLTAREAVSALEVNFGKVYDRIQKMLLHVVAGNNSLDEDAAVRNTIIADELHLYPAVEGAGGGKGWTAILGVALIAVAVVMTGGIAATGAALMGGTMSTGAAFALKMGAALVLSAFVQPPLMDQGKQKAGISSATYSGPINTQTEGAVLPYVAGRDVLVGGVVIHTDLSVEKISTKDDD